MVVSPFRALFTAHLQETWNRSAKEMGQAGTWVMALVAILVAFLLAGPMLLGTGALGYMLAGKLDQARVQTILGGLLAFLCLLGGGVGGIIEGTRQLEWEAYRGFPLKVRTLYFAEMLSGLGDLLPLVLSLALLGLLGGLGIGLPRALPLAALAFIEALLALLAIQILVSGLAAALVKRLRLALLLVGLLAWLLPAFAARQGASLPASSMPPEVQIARLEALGHALERLLALLPTHAIARSLAKAQAGAWLQALRLHLYPLGTLLLLMMGGAHLLVREMEPPKVKRGPRGQARLWSFRTPALGLGRLHFQTIMGSQLGKFAFVIPLVTIVLLKGPFAQTHHASVWSLPVAFAYLSMVGASLSFNQFGLDRHGVKALLLLPIPSEDLLMGKLWGAALHQGLQVLLLVGLLVALNHPDPLHLLASLLLMGCLFLVQNAVGQWTSAWMPRPMLPNSMKSNRLPFPVAMISLFGATLWSAFFIGGFALLAWLAPAWLVPGMAVLFGLVLLGHQALLPHAAAFLDRRREVLVDHLG
jgi:hypothetical protein